MNDFLNALTQSDALTTIDPLAIVFILLATFVVGIVIGFIYMWTHEALSYSRTFVAALAVLPMLVALLMVVMSGSIVVAFGLLGVFGVVRFRNVLKDTRDTSFILWAIMEGLALGTLHYTIALLALVGVGANFLFLRIVSFGLRQRYDAVLTLRVTGDLAARLAAVRPVLKRHATRIRLATDRRTTRDGADLSYRLLLRDISRYAELQSELAGLEGCENVSVYLHEDEAEI